MNNLKIYASVAYKMGKLIFSDERKKNPITMSVKDYLFENKWEIPINFIELTFAGQWNFIGMNHVEYCAKGIGKHLSHKENIDDYIKFTRFIEYDGIDRINCDWCSIANGFSEFCIATMKNNRGIDIFLSSNIFFYLSYYHAKFISLLPKSCFGGYNECSDEEAENFIKDNGIICDGLFDKTLAIFYIKRMITFTRIIAKVEQRWCPFGYMQNMAYERNYYGSDLESVVADIRKFGKVICTSCISELNETHEIIDAKESIYKDFLLEIKNYASA